MPLASVISPQFVRRREDKQSHPSDVRIDQVSDRVEVGLTDVDAKSFNLPRSAIVRREVFTKVLKGETMVRKFVLIKTNKSETSDEFPAYVLHFTDFSPNRKDPLAREVIVSHAVAQIDSLYIRLRDAQVK